MGSSNFSALKLGLSAIAEILNSTTVPGVSGQKRNVSRSPSSPPYGRISKKLSCGDSASPSPDLRGRTFDNGRARSAPVRNAGDIEKMLGNWLEQLRISKGMEGKTYRSRGPGPERDQGLIHNLN